MIHDLRTVAAALRAVPGVAQALVEPDASGGVDCLRLGLAPGADPHAVARAASRLVHERFGTLLHSDQVQIVPEPLLAGAAPLPAPRGGRPEIVRTELVTRGRDVSATVILSLRSHGPATGYARGATTPPGVHRAVAQATLQAVERLVGQGARLELEYVDVSRSGQARTVLVALTLITDTGVERLAGSAVVRDDESGAVVRATLDGLNRRIEMLLAD